MTVSVVINTLNEERNIHDCLETVKWADEIVIVDMYSDDLTVEIASQYTSHIFLHDRTGYVEKARNFAIAKAVGKWILVVDADERVTPELKNEIYQVMQTGGEYVAFRIQIRDFMFGRWVNHGSWKYQKLIRLFMRSQCTWPENVHASPSINGSVGFLRYPLLHYSHLSIERFIVKLNTYTTIRAIEWYDGGVRKPLSTIVGGSLLCFFREYILFQGFRDGVHGFILAALMAVYYFVERVKLWELWYKHDHNSSA